MSSTPPIDGYRYSNASSCHTQAYLMPTVGRELAARIEPGGRVLDVGCGNGSNAALLTKWGYDVVGVDPSKEGIAQGHAAFPHIALHEGSAYDDLRAAYGTFDALISLEVVEHVYAPRTYARTLFNVLRPGGVAILSTPYHGYAKNVALAVTGKLDKHFTALWDHGHIKFWSMPTLQALLEEVGFKGVAFHRVGRVPPLAKSMIAVAQKPRE